MELRLDLNKAFVIDQATKDRLTAEDLAALN